jgi:chaperonin GroEL
MKLDRGYMSPYFVTDTERMVTEFVNPYILLYDQKITSLKSILPLLEVISKQKRSVFIVCEDIDGGVLSTMVTNRVGGLLSVCAVKCPDFGENRKEIMKDMAILTGCEFITNEVGKQLESTTIEMLGGAESVIVTKDSFSIVGGKGEPSEVKKRCDQIKAVLKTTNLEYEKEKLKNRLAKLASGVAVIKVGGVTELEIKERKDRIDDAVCATLSAKEQGYVAGGGVSYLHASKELLVEICESQDEQKGIDIVKESLKEPFKQILSNGGIGFTGLIEEIQNAEYGFGYNIKTNVKEDLIKAGVIDSTKVTIVALQNAASIAGVLLTTECVIS